MKTLRWLVLCVALLFALPVFAQTPTYTTGGELQLLSDQCLKEGTCNVDEFYRLVARGANFMLALVGALLLVMFVYGGFWMIISGGNAERVAKAKSVFVGSVIGLILVFGGYTIVNTVLGGIQPGGTLENGSDLINGYSNINNVKGTLEQLKTNQEFQENLAVKGCCLSPDKKTCSNGLTARDCGLKDLENPYSFYPKSECTTAAQNGIYQCLF